MPPCSRWPRILNAFISMLHCRPVSCQWPYAEVQEKAWQEGCNSMAFPARRATWQGQHCCTLACSPSLPPTWPWKAAGWGRRGDRQLLLLQSHPAWGQGLAALGQANGHGRAALVTATMGAAIAGTLHEDSGVPNRGRKEGDLFK